MRCAEWLYPEGSLDHHYHRCLFSVRGLSQVAAYFPCVPCPWLDIHLSSSEADPSTVSPRALGGPGPEGEPRGAQCPHRPPVPLPPPLSSCRPHVWLQKLTMAMVTVMGPTKPEGLLHRKCLVALPLSGHETLPFEWQAGCRERGQVSR